MLVREVVEGRAAAVVVYIGAVEVGIIARNAEGGVGQRGGPVKYRWGGEEEVGRILRRGAGSKR